MTKKSKTLLILSCIFVTIALILSLIHLIISYGTYSVFFNNPENLGEALGEVFAIIIFIEIALQTWTYKYLEWDILAGVDTFRQYNTDLTEILGVQGRYWIPCLPLILVALSGTSERKNVKVYYGVQVVYYIIVYNLYNIFSGSMGSFGAG